MVDENATLLFVVYGNSKEVFFACGFHSAIDRVVISPFHQCFLGGSFHNIVCVIQRVGFEIPMISDGNTFVNFVKWH